MCDLAKVYDENRVIARKEHKCCECRLPIKKGEAHWKCTGLWDVWSTFRQHIHCYHFARGLNRSYEPDECIPFGGVKEYLFECDEDGEEMRFWNAMISGVNEEFLQGDGI